MVIANIKTTSSQFWNDYALICDGITQGNAAFL